MKYKKIVILLLVVMSLNTLAGCTNVSKNTENTSPIIEQKQNGETYTSKQLGVSIDFPKSWADHYVATEILFQKAKIGYMKVSFFGDSMTSQGIKGITQVPDGLCMFYIGTKEAFDTDGGEFVNMKRLGTFKGKDYYYATSTESPIVALKDPKGAAYGLPVDKRELELCTKDIVKVEEMENQVDSVVKTFRVN